MIKKLKLSIDKSILIISFLIFSISLTYSAFLLKYPTGDQSAVHFPILAKLIDGQGFSSFTPLRMGFLRTPAINLLAYIIHFIFRTNTLNTVRIYLAITSISILVIFYLLIAKMWNKS